MIISKGRGPSPRSASPSGAAADAEDQGYRGRPEGRSHRRRRDRRRGHQSPGRRRPEDLALALEESALSALGESAAPAAIVARGAETPARLRAVIAVDFPRYAMATLTRLFANAPHAATGTHPTAVVDPSAVIEDSVSIGPFVVRRARRAHRPGNGHPSPCHHRRSCPDRRRMPVPSRRQDRRAGRDRRPGHPASQLQHRGRWLQFRHSRAGVAAAPGGPANLPHRLAGDRDPRPRCRGRRQ